MVEDETKTAEGVSEGEGLLEAELEPLETRAKSPWKAFILTGILAGLMGAGAGGYGAYAALKKFAPTPVVQTDVDLSPIQTQLKQLTDRVSAAETEVQSVSNRPVVEAKPVDMSGLEERLKALESAPAPDIDPEALSALQAAQKDGFEWPDTTALETRIAALEAKADDAATETSSGVELPADLMERLTALEADVERVRNAEPALVPEIDEDILSGLEARLSTLENRPPPAATVKRVSILAFPKAQMVAAVEANMEGSIIQKALSRHIRVKDENDPLTLIDGIENDLSDGRLTAAVEKFERLPSPVRAAGQAWYESVKASL